LHLTPGTRIGSYEVVSVLGTGGMGQVYRGRDLRLHRDVAIKVLLPEVADNSERLARFSREAQVLASLNHPNIAHIHGLEESSTTPALIMELVEGDTLADRLAHSALTVGEATHIARQLADALDAAHERGIIHRDLKPANIKVTPDGTVKVLDFGLAKAQDAPSSDAMYAPTMTSPALMSRAGVILGTAAYMSPEQARGAVVDKRADIWAFGCVLFEMLTARRVFDSDSMTETLAAVMRDDIRLDRLPAATPPSIAHLITRCLERDPKRRLRDIGEARIALDEVAAPSSRVDEQARAAVPIHARMPSRVLPWVVTAAAIALTGYFAFRPSSTTVRESLELEIGPPTDARFLIESNSGNVLLSPDGSKIVFRALTSNRDALWIRSLARDDARPLTGTENAQYPFWAPDSRRLAFFAGGKLKTLDTVAGLAQVIADAPNGRGGSWGDDDVIVFSPSGGGTIFKVAAGGGQPVAVTHLDTSRSENAHYWPVVLPGSRKFLYLVRSARPENNGIYVAASDGSGATRLISGLSSAIYAPPLDESPGDLLWVQNGELLAQPFDADTAALSGQPSPIASGVRVLEGQLGTLASVSRTGALAWASARAALGRFVWFDRDGRRRDPLAIEEGIFFQPTISPDGTRLLYTSVVNGTADIYLHDFEARRSQRITPSPDYDEQPVWSPDSSEMMHDANESGMASVRRVRLDGSVPPVDWIHDSVQYSAVAWSPDGRHVLVSKNAPGNGLDTLVFPADDAKKISPLLTGSANDVAATFSPDGRWIAFASDRSGRNEVYVVRFRGDQSPPAISGLPVQITTDGGVVIDGGWRRNSQEIVFRAADGQVMAASVNARNDSLTVGRPRMLFRTTFDQGAMAVTPDGNRFVVIEYPYAAGQTIHVLTNWRARLDRSK
jgi:eukaryotic-like serine/threonine-protein kinase